MPAHNTLPLVQLGKRVQTLNLEICLIYALKVRLMRVITASDMSGSTNFAAKNKKEKKIGSAVEEEQRQARRRPSQW